MFHRVNQTEIRAGMRMGPASPRALAAAGRSDDFVEGKKQPLLLGFMPYFCRRGKKRFELA